jgi:hypothetical protein
VCSAIAKAGVQLREYELEAPLRELIDTPAKAVAQTSA